MDKKLKEIKKTVYEKRRTSLKRNYKKESKSGDEQSNN